LRLNIFALIGIAARINQLMVIFGQFLISDLLPQLPYFFDFNIDAL